MGVGGLGGGLGGMGWGAGGAGDGSLCLALGSRMRPRWGAEGWGAEKCGRRRDFLGAEGELWRVGPGKVGSCWGPDAGRLPGPPSPPPSQLRRLQHRAGEERIPRAGSAPAPAARAPTADAWGGSQGGAESGGHRSPSKLGPAAAGRGGRAVRPADWAAGYAKEARSALQVAPPRSLKFAAGEGTDSVHPPRPAPAARPDQLSLPSPSARPAATPLGSPAPLGSRIPSPVSIPPSARAPRSLPPRWISDKT